MSGRTALVTGAAKRLGNAIAVGLARQGTNVIVHYGKSEEEISGPVVSLITVKDFDEAIERIEAGITYINSSNIGAEVHLPFGGIKHTGIGTREAGIEGINEFSETKTAYIDYSGKLQKAQIDIE